MVENTFSSILDFPEATGLKTEVGQQKELDNFYMNKTS
jgi:hypothetical protein